MLPLMMNHKECCESHSCEHPWQLLKVHQSHSPVDMLGFKYSGRVFCLIEEGVQLSMEEKTNDLR